MTRPSQPLARGSGRLLTFLASAAIALFGALGAHTAHAQQAVVGNLRLAADAEGAPLDAVPAGPGEKVYALAKDAERLFIAFDYKASSPERVQVRVMGPMGAVMFQSDETYEAPGTHVIEFDNGGLPLEETEYVVNAYVSDSLYLADSLQATVGEARLSPASNEQSITAPEPQTIEMPIDRPGADLAAAAPAGPTPGPSAMLLVVAGIGVLALLGVVAWAGMSALGRR